MLESKIDETNELIHKLIDEVFPSVYASFDILDKRISRLEKKIDGEDFTGLRHEIIEKQRDVNTINDKLNGLQNDIKSSLIKDSNNKVTEINNLDTKLDDSIVNNPEKDDNNAIIKSQVRDGMEPLKNNDEALNDNDQKEIQTTINQLPIFNEDETLDEILSLRQQKKILNTLSCNYNITKLEDSIKFFDIYDKLFETTSTDYYNKYSKGLVYPNLEFTEFGIIKYLIELFNFKYKYWVPDSIIVLFTNLKIKDYKQKHHQKLPKNSNVFNDKIFGKKIIDWDKIMLLIYQYKFKNTKEFIINCIELLHKRNQVISRPGSNFVNLIKIFDLVRDNLKNLMMTTSEAIVLLSKIYNSFLIEIEYLIMFLPELQDFKKFKDIRSSNLYSQELKIMGYKLPEDWLKFLDDIIKNINNNLNELKYIFLEDLKLYLQNKSMKLSIQNFADHDLTVVKKQLNNYCIKLSKFWDNYQFENLFFLLYYNSNIDRILDLEKLKYYKFLKYELLEYLNFIPMVLMFVINEIIMSNVHDKHIEKNWDVKFLNDNLLIISSILITNLKFRNLLEACLFVVFNDLNYKNYLNNKMEIEPIMFKVMGDLIVDNIDLIKLIINNYLDDLQTEKPYNCLLSLRNPFKLVIDKDKLNKLFP